MTKLSKLNWGTIIGVLGLLATIIFGLPIYWNITKPDLIAQGNTSAWFIPGPVSGQVSIKTQYMGVTEPATDIGYLQNVRTYIAFSINNDGSEIAEDVRLNLSYDGIYSIDFGETTSTFNRVINLGELRPKESKYISVWTNTNEPEQIKKALVNYKNGSEEVDFGIQAFGVWENIFLFINKFWILIVLVSLFIILLLIVNLLEKRSKGNIISPYEKKIKNGLKIIHAIYGTHERSIDVTSILNDEININGFLDIFVINKIFGDPHYGAQKQLKVKYMLNDREHDAIYTEGVRLRLP